MDNGELGFPYDTLHAQIVDFGILFTSGAQEPAREIYRMLEEGGTAVLTCWKLSSLFSMFLDAQDIVRPATPIKDLVILDEWSDPQTLQYII